MTKKQWIIGGGIAVAVLGVGYYMLRPKQASMSGAWDYTVDTPIAVYRADRQIAKAVAGDRLTDYRKAEDSGKMLTAAAYNAEAYAKVAYWLAVASRILGSRALAATAAGYHAKATLTYGLPGSSFLTGGVADIYKDGVAALPASSNRSIASIRTVLGEHGKAGAIRTRRQQEDDRAVTYNTTAQSATDVADMTTYAKAVVTGNKPPGEGDVSWFFKKWGWRLGAGAVILIGLRFAFANEYHALRGVFQRRGASAQPKQIEMKQEAA